MTILLHLENQLLRHLDAICARLPQPPPPTRRLAAAKIIAHRGIHDNRRIPENTLAAFQRAADQGIWGVELDVRWTRDGEAVICHDPDLRRVFGIPDRVHTLRLADLQKRCPQVPTLAEVIAAVGTRLHLMIELKAVPGDPDGYPHRRLASQLDSLRPVQDYHLMALDPVLLAHDAWPPEVCLPIARLKVDAYSRLAERRRYAGLCGHYALVRRRHIVRHRRCGQQIGTGFITSRASLYREMNRGVVWLFTNCAPAMQRICQAGESA
ncbi:MAG: glycerophosphodiester phosphodiesterase family protein [Desulfosarcinaceae bacterium]|nr:glycerophosphodiester phosphodiesterase family protein [Desulfosarcinaceae bacterium]